MIAVSSKKIYGSRSLMVPAVLVVAVAVALLGVMAGTSGAAAGDTTRVSVSSSGTQGNGHSTEPFVSADGRFVAFQSSANNLVPGDTNGKVDVFVRDRQTHTTRRVSVGSSDNQANGESDWPSISADGRFVAFQSSANNLVPRDTNGGRDVGLDVFVRDRQAGTTRRVSISSSGDQTNNGNNFYPSISANGRFVAFGSNADNLVPNDTNGGFSDVFVHNLRTGTTRLVSVSSSGDQRRQGGYSPSISADGRFVVFTSSSSLVPGDTNFIDDVFVRDRQAGTLRRVSISSSGDQANDEPYGYPASISADGRFVAFGSFATNLVPHDTNGDLDVFVRDRQAGTLRRVSISSSGDQANNGSHYPSISADGRFVAFSTDATNLVPHDTNRDEDVFVRDRRTGTTQRVSVDSSGNQANGFSGDPSIDSVGRFVAFTAFASDLVPHDTNSGKGDVFVHEFRVDVKAPRVASVAPVRGATGVFRGVDVKAAFSERVYNVESNFKLYHKGSGTSVAAAVHPVTGSSASKWVLNPDEPLRAGTTYVAKVKTDVVDKVGHHLDQSPTRSGDQPMRWTFKTRR
jgi:Tol biopolymer transport system component